MAAHATISSQKNMEVKSYIERLKKSEKHYEAKIENLLLSINERYNGNISRSNSISEIPNKSNK